MLKNIYSGICLLLLLVSSANAQIDSAFRFLRTSPNFIDTVKNKINYLNAIIPNDTLEGGETNSLLRFESFMGSRVSNTVNVGEDIALPLNNALKISTNNFSSYCMGSTGFNGNWQCLGPFTSYLGNVYERQGRINALWVKPSDVNTILAGSDGGGLWKTTNGGQTWFNISDGINGSNNVIPGTMGIHCLAVNPLNENVIYVALRITSEYKKSVGYDLGLAYTTDGGSSWNSDAGFSTVTGKPIPSVGRVAYMPATDKLFALHEGKVFYKSSASASWTEITPSSSIVPDINQLWMFDIKFTKQNPGKAVISTSSFNGVSHLLVYDVNTSAWTDNAITFPSGYTQSDWADGILKMSVSSSDVVFMHGRANNMVDGILLSTPLSAINVSLINANFSLNYEAFEVSPSNSSIIYGALYASNPLMRSTDGGASFFSMSAGRHPDGRALYLFSTTNTSNGIDDVVYYGSDGGVGKKSSGSTTALSITGTGLACTEFYGFGNTEMNEDLIIGGAQDNGGYNYVKDRVPEEWNGQYTWADGYTAKFRKNRADGFGELNGSQLHPMYTIAYNATSYSTSGVPTPADLPISNVNRPQLHFENGDAHVGYSRLWLMVNGTTSWTRALPLTDPIDNGTLNPDQKIVADFYIHETNTNIVYVAFRDAAYADPTGSTNRKGKLYYSDNANDINGPIWNNRTPSIVEFDCINSIAIDPLNTNRIWIALGNINDADINKSPAAMVNRILYSNNAGQSWSDVSTGLTPMPVNKLIYRQGSNDEIYAGTDAGIFRWNKNQQKWECFNGGMPQCIVMDLEFNYCAGKLRAATFGRGIWETDIMKIDNNSPQIGDIIPVPTEEITTNTTWNNEKYIISGIHVSNGATLTITNTGSTQTVVHMPKNGRILVEPGAKLVVDGAKLTNSCDKCMWYGIQAKGQSNKSQTAVNQATVIIKNGAVIENARFAVNNSEGDFWTNSGGIIQAENSTFLNNKKSAQFLYYRNYNFQYDVLNDKSYFMNCTFEVNDDYKGDAVQYPFDAHITMWEVNGIQIDGCKFYNNVTNPYGGERRYGIISYNAGYSIFPYCTGNSIPCNGTLNRSEFKGFRCGIIAEGDIYNLGTLTVDQADFDANSIGVRVKNIDNVSVLRSTFDIGHAPGIEITDCYENAGTYTTNSHNFRIEENVYTGYTDPNQHAGWMNVGAVTEASGANDNDIYRNTFTNLTIGGLALDKNSDPYLGFAGLHYKCNEFNGTKQDIVVSCSTPSDGIAGIQGVPDINSGSYLSAGNKYSSSMPQNIYNSGHPLTFYFDNGNAPVVPSNVLTILGNSYGCPSRITDGGVLLTGLQRTGIIGRKNDDRSILPDLKAGYASLIDSGNTQNTIDEVSTMNGIDAQGYLMAIAPFVSETVLRYVGDNHVMTTDLMQELFEANPDVLRNTAFLDYAEDLSLDRDSLEAAAKQTSARTGKEAEISYYQQDLANCYNLLLTDIKNDTGFVNAEDIPDLLTEQGTLSSLWSKVAYYFTIGNLEEAQTVFEGIKDDITLTDQENDSYDSYATILSILTGVKNNNSDYKSISASDIEKLNVIATDFEGMDQGHLASSILDHLDNKYTIPCKAPMASMRLSPPSVETQKHSDEAVTAYPNPATSQVVFSYHLPDAKDGSHLVVTSVNGKEVAKFELTGIKGVVHWYTKEVPNGVYFYQVSDSRKNWSKGKVVIMK